MEPREYTAREALGVLLDVIGKHDEDLFDIVQSAIDAGKDTTMADQSLLSRKKQRMYRKHVPLTDAEALRMVVQVVRAYALEIPKLTNAAIDIFAQTGLSVRATGSLFERAFRDEAKTHVGVEKSIQIEIRTETQIVGLGPETFDLSRVSNDDLIRRQSKIDRLFNLVNFSEN